MSGDPENLTGLIIYFLAIVGLVVLILGLSHVLGQRRRDKATIEPFESGVVSVGDAQLRFSAPFFLVAIFFVIFDLEAVFLFAWVIGFRESGIAGFIEALIFILILLAGLAYLWKMGALDWNRSGGRVSQSTGVPSTGIPSTGIQQPGKPRSHRNQTDSGKED